MKSRPTIGARLDQFGAWFNFARRQGGSLAVMLATLGVSGTAAALALLLAHRLATSGASARATI